MEKNFISRYQPTCFYVNLEAKQYGVCVNIKDIDEAEEIIKQCLEQNKRSIEAWKELWKEGVA